VRIIEGRGHGEVIEQLWRAAAAERLPHSLSFEGKEGIGKYAAATWFAMGLLCEKGPGRPCGSCGPCTRVLSGGDFGNHPDLLTIDPALEEEERIRVHRIAYRPGTSGISHPERCVENFLDLRSVEGRGRVIVIRESERMNGNAQNALLKNLEEPRPGNVLILITDRAELLLPTIRSRCVRVGFDSLDAEDCRAVLGEQGLERERAVRLTRWSGGSPGRALLLAERGAEAIREIVIELLRGEITSGVATRRIWEVEGKFPGKSLTAKSRERARVAIDLIGAVLSDLHRFTVGLESDELAHGDLAEELFAGGRRDAIDLGGRVEALVGIRGEVERNVAPELLVERALLVSSEGCPILSGTPGATA
jgi:DNA polymerase III subunit delta'